MPLFKSKSIPLQKFFFRNHGLYPYTSYKTANWEGMKQALEAYHQDMLESRKYSSLNVVQLWDDLHSSPTFLTNKFIPSKLSSTRKNIFLGSTQNSNGLLDKETELFRYIGNQVNLLIEKFLDLKHLFRKSIKLSNPSFLEYIFDMASNDHTSKLYTKTKSSHFSNIPNKILPLLHLYANTILSIRTPPRKPLF